MPEGTPHKGPGRLVCGNHSAPTPDATGLLCSLQPAQTRWRLYETRPPADGILAPETCPAEAPASRYPGPPPVSAHGPPRSAQASSTPGAGTPACSTSWFRGSRKGGPPPALLPGPLPSHCRSFCHRRGREVRGLSNAQSWPWISLVRCCGWAERLEWDGVWALALGERDGGLGGRGRGGAGPTWACPPSRPSAFL